MFVYFMAFAVVAVLVNHLGEELRIKGKELKQKQLDYRRLEAFHQNIVQSLDSGLITTDPNGKVSFLNRTAYRILGITEEYRSPSRDLDALLSPLVEILTEERVTSNSQVSREEIAFCRPDGKTIQLGISRSPLREMHSDVVGSILIFQDITRIKEMEERIRRADRMVSIGHMAAGIAHEIRNPLASLSGSIQVLREDTPSNEGNLELMDIILRESDRLNRLITDFLLFAQPPKCQFGPITLNQLIYETLQMVRNSPDFDGHISLSAAYDHEVRVLGDANQLRQVLWNLFLNAIQEMRDGGELGVAVGLEGDFAKVAVSDTGRGIDNPDQGKIFEPFFTTKESGTGLGLAIAHRIVESHGGEIRVESAIGQGTTFTLLLPQVGQV
jgi:two-component system sensor histidine kinase PilS (NtrC family)